VRKTVAIDDDVANLVAEEIYRSGDSFKTTINRLLRLRLAASATPQVEGSSAMKPRPLGIGDLPDRHSWIATAGSPQLDRHNGSVSSLLEELVGPDQR
jgi:hypothetical protein